MLPNEIAEYTLIDIAELLSGKMRCYRDDEKRKSHERYEQAYLNCLAFDTALAHLMKGGRSIKFPSYEEVFSENIRKENEQKGIYTKIDKTNASKFLSAQLKAYKNMGYSQYENKSKGGG